MNAAFEKIDYDPGDLPPGVAPGAVVAGKYRLDRVIGMGGMGSVWEAVHLGLHQPVALKIVSPEFARSTEARRRFDTEAKAAAQLRSRHVVAVSDNGELDDGTPFMAMELLRGEPLGKRIHKFGPLPVLDALRVAIQVGRALSKAHGVGIVHRDIKPENIFLATSDEEPGYVAKVLDFGIAKVRATNAGEQSATRTGSLLGTPLYMSPEQARALKNVDHRSDVYSLGLVVYTMLTGNLAFSGESYADVIVQICTQPVPSIRQSAPWIPEQVDQWLQVACAKEPEQRYQDVQSMVDALCLAAGYPPGTPDLAQPIGPGQPAFPYAGTVPLVPSREDVLGTPAGFPAQSTPGSGAFPRPVEPPVPGPLPPPPTPPPGYVSASQAPPPMGPPAGAPMPMGPPMGPPPGMGPPMGTAQMAPMGAPPMAPQPYQSSGATNFEPPKRSVAPWIALAVVLVLGGGGAGLYFSGALDEVLGEGKAKSSSPKDDDDKKDKGKKADDDDDKKKDDDKKGAGKKKDDDDKPKPKDDDDTPKPKDDDKPKDPPADPAKDPAKDPPKDPPKVAAPPTAPTPAPSATAKPPATTKTDPVATTPPTATTVKPPPKGTGSDLGF